MSSSTSAPIESETAIIQGLNQVNALMMEVGVSAGETSETLMDQATDLSTQMDAQQQDNVNNVASARGYQQVMAWVAPMSMMLVQGLLAAEYAGGGTFSESAKIFGTSVMKGLQVGAFGAQATVGILEIGNAYYNQKAAINQGNITGLETTQGVLSETATSIGQITDESIKTSSSVFASELETILNNGQASRPQNN